VVVGGAHQFLQLEDHLLCVSTRDSVINDLGPANDASYSLSAFHGKFRLTAAQFMRATSSLRPDIIVALADECPSSVTAGRAKKSVYRSISWYGI
jgi:queuine/archaeosine tRNA-ribosyltransferase